MQQSDLTETRIDREQLIDGVLLKVYRDNVRLPDGGTSVREWIDHPGASAVVPLFENGDTILIRQFRYPPNREFIEVPAGKLDEQGENPESVARREVEEETGFKVETLVHLGSFYPCIGYSNEIIHVYLGEGLSEGNENTDHEEFIEAFRVPFEEAVRMVFRGEIMDMKTIVAVLLAERYVNHGDTE